MEDTITQIAILISAWFMANTAKGVLEYPNAKNEDWKVTIVFFTVVNYIITILLAVAVGARLA